jgi:hypothetical protein
MSARGPGRAVAGAPAGEIPGGGGGLLGAAEVVAVKADQGQDAVREHVVIGRADLVRQLEACLKLGDRVIPLPGDEALEGKEHLVDGQGPADAALLADPHPDAERGPGLLGPVELDEDVSPGCADRIAVSEPARALVGQVHRLVGDLERVPEMTAGFRDPGQRGHGDADGQVIAG